MGLIRADFLWAAEGVYASVLLPFDHIEGATVPGHANLYVVGSFDSRITFYSQQVRALSLAHALVSENTLKPNARVAIIGGGICGVTLASALALAAPGLQPIVFEKAAYVLPLQSASTRRRIDPHLYDWPSEEADQEVAELPILDWTSGSARDVRAAILQEFENVRGRTGDRIVVNTSHDVRNVTPAGDGYEVEYLRDRRGTEAAEANGRVTGRDRVDTVIFAFGFGMDTGTSLAPVVTESYWSDAGVPAQEIGGNARPRYFVSGNGDGGLIDFVAAADAHFDHAATIRAIRDQVGIQEIADRIRSIDVEARKADAAGRGFDFMQAYEQSIGQAIVDLGLVGVVGARLRHGVQLVLQTRDANLMSIKTSALNRLATYLIIKACDLDATASFRHIVCAEPVAVPQPADSDPAAFWFDCDGEIIGADRAIVRRGPDRASAREPFIGILAGFEESHAQWLARQGEQIIVPRLSEDSRSFFKSKALEAELALPVHAQAAMAAQLPRTVKVMLTQGGIRWTGDFAPTDGATIWGTLPNHTHIVCDAGPTALGSAAHAIARLAMHTDKAAVLASVPLWRPFVKELTEESPHAADFALPELQAIGQTSTNLNPQVMTSDELASVLNGAMDGWVIGKIDYHMNRYLNQGMDQSNLIGFEIAPDLRTSMWAIWTEWRGSFDAAPQLANRFLRLVLCAVDQDDTVGVASTLVGPRKLKPIVRATAVALAIASCWTTMTPNEAKPGNLGRNTGAVDAQTGHVCAAELIGRQDLSLIAARFIWKTNFVVFPMYTQPARLIASSSTSFGKSAGDVPVLTEAGQVSNIILTVDVEFREAAKAGTAALASLLAEIEAAHFERMQKAVEAA